MRLVKTDDYWLIDVRPKEWEEFKTLVNRAMNCWPDASPEMKEFADRINGHDKPLQNYHAQSNTKPRPE